MLKEYEKHANIIIGASRLILDTEIGRGIDKCYTDIK